MPRATTTCTAGLHLQSTLGHATTLPDWSVTFLTRIDTPELDASDARLRVSQQKPRCSIGGSTGIGKAKARRFRISSIWDHDHHQTRGDPVDSREPVLQRSIREKQITDESHPIRSKETKSNHPRPKTRWSATKSGRFKIHKIKHTTPHTVLDMTLEWVFNVSSWIYSSIDIFRYPFKCCHFYSTGFSFSFDKATVNVSGIPWFLHFLELDLQTLTIS